MQAVKPNLYAKLDGNRKPWWIVAIKHTSNGVVTRDFRVASTEALR